MLSESLRSLSWIYLTDFTNKYWALNGSGQVICISVYPDHDVLYTVDILYIFLNKQITNLNNFFFPLGLGLSSQIQVQTRHLPLYFNLLFGKFALLQHKGLDVKEYNRSKSPLGWMWKHKTKGNSQLPTWKAKTGHPFYSSLLVVSSFFYSPVPETESSLTHSLSLYSFAKICLP